MYVDVVSSYVDVAFYTSSLSLPVFTVMKCQHFFQTCQHCYYDVSTHSPYVSTYLHIFINLSNLVVNTMSTHLLSKSTSLGIYQLIVSTHITYVSIFFNVFFKLCRHMINMCRLVFKTYAQCVDVLYMHVDLSSTILISVSTFFTCTSTCLQLF